MYSLGEVDPRDDSGEEGGAGSFCRAARGGHRLGKGVGGDPEHEGEENMKS